MGYEIIIYGKGDFARLMLHNFSTDSNYRVVAFCVDKEYLDTDNFCGLPLVSIDDVELRYSPDKNYAFVAIGYKNMRAR